MCLLIIVLLVVIRITPLQQLNPLAAPRDCFPVMLNGEEVDPSNTKTYEQYPIRTALFGMRCIQY